MKTIRISVAEDFSRTPGPRFKSEGQYSGEEFLSSLLLPGFTEAQSSGGRLLIDLDGTEGYATSFLEAAFGGLTRKFDARAVLAALELKSEDEPYLLDEIKKYITDAKK
jgi:hypothetical protein